MNLMNNKEFRDVMGVKTKKLLQNIHGKYS